MISRKTTLTLSQLFSSIFYTRRKSRGQYNRNIIYIPDTDKLYDFLFTEGYETRFCNTARHAAKGFNNVRPLQDFIMGLHTGESLENISESLRLEQRINLGQEYLINLSEDILNYWHNEFSLDEQKNTEDLVNKLINQLELDGYIYNNPRLLIPEEDIFDVEEERSYLKNLYLSLNLAKRDIAFHHLDLSEDDYIDGNWDDSISNSRKFFECVLMEIASDYSLRKQGSPIKKIIYDTQWRIRDFLLSEGLIDAEEKEAISSVYGLLSHTGSHPYIARKDQARLLRNLALTLSQFVLLRYHGVTIY